MSEQSFTTASPIEESPVSKRPISLEWSREQVLQLVELYHSHPALWDTCDSKFKDRQVRRWALVSIASQMSLPTIDVEKKIHCLRTQFNREYLKMKTNARKPTWFAYQPLAFVLRNKQDAGLHVRQWDSALLNIKEEFMDEDESMDEGDDFDERLASEECSSVNNDASSENVTAEGVTKMPLTGGNRVEVRESNGTMKPPHTHTTSGPNLQSLLKPVDTSNDNDNCRNEQTNENGGQRGDNRMLTVNDEDLYLYGKLIADELFRVQDFYTLQLAKYEISKIIFKATIGCYNKSVMEHINWELDGLTGTFDDCSNDHRRTNDHRTSTAGELKVFSDVAVNELTAVTDRFALRVAKLYINQVLFQATTAGLAPKSKQTRPTPPLN